MIEKNLLWLILIGERIVRDNGLRWLIKSIILDKENWLKELRVSIFNIVVIIELNHSINELELYYFIYYY